MDIDLSTLPSTIPVVPAPPGQVTDFDAPNPLAPNIIGLIAAFLTLSVATVCLRVYVRVFIVRAWWWDDTLIVIALGWTIINAAVTAKGLDLGIGKHLWNVRLNTFTPSLVTTISSPSIFYPLAILFIKTSVCVLLWRLFRARGRAFRIAVITIGTFCVLFYTAYFAVEVAAVATCQDPIKTLTTTLCKRNNDVIEILSGAVNVATDLYLVLLPIPVVWDLQMKLARKIGLLLIFTAGAVSTIASLIRLIFVCHHLGAQDSLYNAAQIGQTTIVEVNVGIVAASLSTLPKLGKSPLAASLRSLMTSRSWVSLIRMRRPSGAKSPEPGSAALVDEAQMDTLKTQPDIGEVEIGAAGRKRS